MPRKPNRKSTALTPFVYAATGAVVAITITFVRCEQRQTNTYVRAESGSVIQVVNGDVASGARLRVGTPVDARGTRPSTLPSRDDGGDVATCETDPSSPMELEDPSLFDSSTS